MEQSPSSEAIGHSASQEIPKLEGSLPCSQQFAIGPYSEPNESTTDLPTLFP
jgi:hypothetical protein